MTETNENGHAHENNYIDSESGIGEAIFTPKTTKTKQQHLEFIHEQIRTQETSYDPRMAFTTPI